MDESEFLGIVIGLFWIGGIAWLLFGAVKDWRKDSLRERIANIGFGSSLFCFAIFIVWAMTGGLVPYGQYALPASISFFVVSMVVNSILRKL